MASRGCGLAMSTQLVRGVAYEYTTSVGCGYEYMQGVAMSTQLVRP